MAEDNKKNVSIFAGVLDAVNSNRRKKSTIEPGSPNFRPTQSAPTLDTSGGVENAQQQFLDWQVTKIAHDLYTRTVYYDTDRISAYQDFRAMDGTPEISAALNIIRDECVESNSIIPLLDGTKKRIEDLYQLNYKNFYVYSYNAETKNFEPGLCERVAYKGEQNVYRIVFDDDSYIDATSEHLWLIKGEKTYAKTIDLKENQSIEPFYSKISADSEKIQGYEMLFENGKWEYTHRIVKREIFPDKKGVVHHKDINKLNNTPSNLEVLGWSEHQSLHCNLNSERWKNDLEYSEKMKKVFSKTNSKEGVYWSNSEWRKNRVQEMSKKSKEKFSKYSKEELKQIFGYPGEKNPMFGQGEKIEGEKNGRFLNDKKREFTLDELLYAYENSSNIEEACVILNTTRRILYKSKLYKSLNVERWEDVEFYKREISLERLEAACKKHLGRLVLDNNFNYICKENNWKTRKVLTFLQKNGFNTWAEFVKKFDSKNFILNLVKKEILSSEGKVNFTKICSKMNFTRKQIEGYLKRSEYKNFTNLAKSVNHKIKRVEFLGSRKTYDLINVGKQNNFVVLTSNGTGVISHNCLTRSERGNILEVYSENARVKDVLNDLFRNVLNVEFNLRLWIRDLVKYGDYFVMLQIDKEVGIYDFMTLPTEEVHREEGHDGRLDSIRFRWETTGNYFEEWQVAHFRLLEDSRKLPYGRSLLDSSRKLWKQLQLAEDAMLVYRITRAPERRVFYVEVGNLPDADVKTYMGKVQNQIRKQPIVDTKSGRMSYKYNPENVTEDYWIPIRGDKSSRIETLPGASNLGDIQDIEYLQNKLFAALQVPKTYLNFAEGLQGGSTLSQADLRFARTINSIQEAILLELRRVANIHLYFLGLEDDIDNFTLTLTNPSTQQELLKLETMKARLEVFKEFFTNEATSPTSYTWAMENILDFSKSDIKLILKQKKIEKKIFAEIESAVETYKKIGLFDELDERYEDPEAAAALAASGGAGAGGEEGAGDLGGGGGGGGGALGGLGGDLGGGMGEPGGAPGAEPGAEGGAEPGAEGGAEPGAEEPLKEGSKIQKRYLMNERRIKGLMEELLGPDEAVLKMMMEKRKEKENALIKSNNKLANNTKKLIESIDKKFKNLETAEYREIKDEKHFDDSNSLLESNKMSLEKTKEIFEKLDELTSLNDGTNEGQF